MKKTLSLLVVLAVLLTAGVATAQTTVLPAVTTTTTSSAYPFGNSAGIQAHVYSAAGSSASVVLRGGMTSTGPWATLATITNPSATGECYQGTAWPYFSAVDTHSSGTVTVKARALSANPGAWAPCIASQTSTAPTYGLIKYQWTNAQIVAAGSGVGPLNIAIGTLPAKSVITKTHMIVDGQATFAAGTLTGALGGTATAYVDLIVASDLKGSAGVIYGDAANERGATNIGTLYAAAAKPLTLQILANAGNLADVTGSSGTVYVEYVTYP